MDKMTKLKTIGCAFCCLGVTLGVLATFEWWLVGPALASMFYSGIFFERLTKEEV